MSKRNKKIVILILVTVIALGALSILLLNKQKVPSNLVEGRVTKVVNRPNRAEDGYYGITVQDDLGKDYTINATGYLNTPAPPDQFGEACVDIPSVKVGDSVEFNLPKVENQSNVFDICYKKNQTGYFFKLT
jgi:hypothetical protein